MLTAGAGLADVVAANDPKLFTDPVSLSFSRPERQPRPACRRRCCSASRDAGDGAGTWTVEVRPQAQPSGVEIIVPGSITIAPGGEVQVPVTARALAGRRSGRGLRLPRPPPRCHDVRKVPYAMLVTRPGLASAPVLPLRAVPDRRHATRRLARLRLPLSRPPPSAPPRATSAPPVNEDGAEKLYRIRIDEPAVNVGAAVIASSPGSLVHPWLLGSPDENDVQGYAGTPVNVNNLTIDYPLDIGAAAAVFPRTKAYYVSVDSRPRPVHGRVARRLRTCCAPGSTTCSRRCSG